MADNYCQFSVLLCIDTDEEKDWLENWLKPWSALFPDEDAASDAASLQNEKFVSWCAERDIDNVADDVDTWPSFRWSFDDPTQTEPWTMWIHNDESGVPEHVAAMVQAFFKHFHIDSTFTLTWAETCSKPRVDEFSGGGFIVLPFGEDVRWSMPDTLFREVLDKINKNKKKK